jgi:hypothetical protein
MNNIDNKNREKRIFSPCKIYAKKGRMAGLTRRGWDAL